jgi:hypothetical protein
LGGEQTAEWIQLVNPLQGFWEFLSNFSVNLKLLQNKQLKRYRLTVVILENSEKHMVVPIK